MFEDEDEEEWLTPDFKKRLIHFEQMYALNEYNYIDSDEIEFLLDHLMMSNHLKKAKWAVEKALEHFPSNSLIIIRHAQILSMMGEINAALKILHDLERVEPSNIDILLSIASCHSQLKNNNLAIRYFKKAFIFATDNEKVEIAIDLAMEYENINDYKSAISILENAIQGGVLNDLVIYELAHCYEKINDSKNAIDCFLRYIDEEPYSAATWYNLGNVYAKINQFEKAIWAYDYAILINDSFIPALFNLANTYMDVNNTMEALICYKKCLELDDEDPIIFCSIGECYEDLGETEMAYEMYHKSTELLPQYADAWLGKGVMSDILGFPKRAIQELLVSIDLEPENSECWRTLGNAYEGEEQTDLAREAYEKALALNPDSKEIIIDYLSFLADTSEDLVFEIAETNEDLKNNIATWMVLCFCNWSIGNQTEAMLIFEEIIEKDPVFAKSIFVYFPEMNSVPYYIDRLLKIDKKENNEEL